MSSNTSGQINAMMNMVSNGFDPFKQIEFPDSGNFWVSSAQKANTLSNPFSSLSYNDPGQYQQMNSWSQWSDPTANGKYQGQYQDNNYSMDTAKSMYQQPNSGAWDKYQTNLQKPGEVAAQNAYDQAMQSIKANSGGRGMYGSSVMNQDANNKAGKGLSDALVSNAANAATQTQSAQEQSNQYLANLASGIMGNRTSEWANLGSREQQAGLAQNQFNQTQDSQKLSELGNLNNYNMTNSQNKNNWETNQATNNGKWDWNTMSYDNGLQKSWWDDYYMKGINFNQGERDKLLNNYMNLWGMGNPSEEEARQNSTANAAASRESDSGWGDALEGGLGLLGKIGGYGTGGGSTVFSSIFGLGK